MSVTALPPTCTRPVLAVTSPAPRVYVQERNAARSVFVSGSPAVSAHVTHQEPVSVHVSCQPASRPFALTLDGNFVKLPVAGGGTALVPYLPE